MKLSACVCAWGQTKALTVANGIFIDAPIHLLMHMLITNCMCMCVCVCACGCANVIYTNANEDSKEYLSLIQLHVTG